MKEQPAEVLVLGMHRSGTSMIGGVLKALGVNLGQDSPGKQISNPLGHYEDGEFLKLNEKILREAGGDWDNPPDFQKIYTFTEKFQQEIEDLIHTKTNENKNGIWGWKDPRTSLLAGYYLPFLKNPHIIWCNRYPDEIMSSLWKRNKINQQDGLALIEEYQQRISILIDENPDIPLLKLHYHEVVQNPEKCVLELCDFLNLNVNEDQKSQAIKLILPRKKVNREKRVFQVKYLLSLPSRAYKKLISGRQ